MESADSLDAYSKAHLLEASKRIEKALDAVYIYNQASAAPLSLPFLLFGDSEAKPSSN